MAERPAGRLVGRREKETNEIVSEWTESFKSLTASTREELTSLKETADQAGYSSVSAQLQADIDTLDSMDKEIARLLKRSRTGSCRSEIKSACRNSSTPARPSRSNTTCPPPTQTASNLIRNKVEAEVARAEARGQEVSATVYENAMVSAAEGMSAVNTSLDEQYDKEYALIQLIENSTKHAAGTGCSERQVQQ